MRRLALVVVCVAAGLVAACRSPEEAPPATDGAWLDPQALWTDAASPSTTFDGETGSMLAGPGWAPPEGDGGGGEWGSYAWATATEATLWFSQSFNDTLDFYARCIPYPFEAMDPPQELTVVWNGEEVGSVALRPGWQEVRLPLPRPSRAQGLQELSLRFARTTRPIDLGKSQDARDLAVAVSLAAVVPRRVADPLAFLEARELSPEPRRLVLPIGGGFSLPLPASRRGTIRLGEIEGDCSSCVAELTLLGQTGRATQVWEGALEELSGASVPFDTHGHGVARLVARVTDSSARASWRIRTVALALPDELVVMEPVEPAPAASRPHVFLYLVDTLRADTLAAYGGEPGLTPRMNAFAEGAVVYEDARVASSWTLPSVVSILTGVYPFRHHVMKGNVKYDAEALPGLGRLLAERGYETVGISQSFVAGDAFGIDGDFEDFFLNNQLNAHKLRSQSIRKALVHWLTGPGRDEAPIFAYLHTVDPHAPYSPPPGYTELAEAVPGALPEAKYRPSVFMTEGLASMPREVEHLKALYLGEVAYTDHQFGLFLDLLRRLDLYEPSLIVLVSDHGEEFAEHGGFDHGRTLYDELLRTPLLVKFPGDRWSGTSVARPVSTVDILPTVLALAGDAGAAGSRHGEDLAPGAADPDAGRRGIFAEVNPAPAPHASGVDLRALAVAGLKCIHDLEGVDQFGRQVPEWSVYDLTDDPAEQAPLDLASIESRRCREALGRWLEARRAEDDGEEPGGATSEETREHLRALGYIQ